MQISLLIKMYYYCINKHSIIHEKQRVIELLS